MTEEVRREIANEIEIEADAETVWKAISEGEELKRWFPLDARVTPGVGGAVWLSWGEGADWESPITIWEPNRHLQTTDEGPVKIAVDYIIEARGGETVLRIVQTGFGADVWDDEVDATTNAGWRTFLANLKHYLERHRGEPRTMIHDRHPVVPLRREEAFQRILTAFGFSPDAIPAAGQRYEVAFADDRFEGVIHQFAPPMNLTATVENHGDAFLMIEIEPGKERCRPALWLSLYGEAGSGAESFAERLQGRVSGAFADVRTAAP